MHHAEVVRPQNEVALFDYMAECVAPASMCGSLVDWECCLDHHIPVPTAIGSKHASLVHKVHCLLHTLAVDLGSAERVRQFCSRVMSFTTDHGTESLLVQAPTCILTGDFLPSAGGLDRDRSIWAEAGMVGMAECDGEVGEAAGAQLDLGLLLPNSLWMPGCMHLLHTVSGELLKILETCKDWYMPKIQAVVHFLTTPWLVERFRAKCLEGGPKEAHDFESLFKGAIKCSIAEWRWLSLQNSVEKVLERQVPLRVYYSESKMNKAHCFENDDGHEVEGVARREHPAATTAPKGSGDVGAVLRNPMFWAYSHMIACLEEVLKDFEMLFFACPCCPARKEAMLMKKQGGQRIHVPECFMAGRIGAWLALGEWRNDLETLLQTSSRHMVGYTMELPSADRSAVIDDFSRAKSRFVFVLQAKLACYSALPLQLLGLSHFDEAKAAQAAQAVVRGIAQIRAEVKPEYFAQMHARIRVWAAHEDELKQLAAGTKRRRDLDLQLQHEIMYMMFVCVNETSMEGKHALGKCRMSRRSAAHPSPELLSTELRFNEFHRRYHEDPNLYRYMQEQFELCFHNDAIIMLFGMEANRSLHRALEQRHKLDHRDVALALYHCDTSAQYDPRKSARKQAEKSRKAKRARTQPKSNPLRDAIARHGGGGVSRLDQLVWKAAAQHLEMHGSTKYFYTCNASSGAAVETVRDRYGALIDASGFACLDDSAAGRLHDGIAELAPDEPEHLDLAGSDDAPPDGEMLLQEPCFGLEGTIMPWSPSTIPGAASAIVSEVTAPFAFESGRTLAMYTFRIVHCTPFSVKTAPIAGRQRDALPCEVAVTFHNIQGVLPSQRRLQIALDPASVAESKQPVCLWQPPIGLSNSAWHALLVEWHLAGDVEFEMSYAALPGIDGAVARAVCTRLIKSEAFPPLADVATVLPVLSIPVTPEEAEHSQCLERMLEAGWVQRVALHANAATWRMSKQGMQVLQCTVSIKPERRFFQCNRGPLEALDKFGRFELWDYMCSRGWQLEFSTPAKLRDKPDFVHGGNLVMYISNTAQALPRWCMIAHLQCQDGKLVGPIPKLASESDYKCLVHPEQEALMRPPRDDGAMLAGGHRRDALAGARGSRGAGAGTPPICDGAVDDAEDTLAFKSILLECCRKHHSKNKCSQNYSC